MHQQGAEARLKLELERAIQDYGVDRRLVSRAPVGSGEPVVLNLLDKTFNLYDIGTGGFSFFSDESWPQGWWLIGDLNLPGQHKPIDVKALVIKQNKQGLVRCRFVGLLRIEIEQLKEYVQSRIREIGFI